MLNSYEKERGNACVSIFNWLRQGITPIINENDPIADQEIELWEKGISENDRMAGIVARKISADAILFLTDEGGIYTADPKNDPQAKKFEEIPPMRRLRRLSDSELEPNIRETMKGENQGMAAKWREASSCYRRGMRVAIASANEPNVVINFAENEPVGTRIGTVARLKQ